MTNRFLVQTEGDQAPTPSRRSLLQGAAAVSLGGVATLVLSGCTASQRLVRRATGNGAFNDSFAALEQRFGGRLGVSALDLADGYRVEWRSAELFPMCSTFKVLLVAAVLQASASDNTLLARRLRWRAADVVPYSPVTGSRLESGMTVGELCMAAIQASDNTAANVLLSMLGGPGAVTALAVSLGDNVTRLDRNEPSLNTAVLGDVRDTTTPAAMTSNLQRLVLAGSLPLQQQIFLQRWLRTSTTGRSRIRAGVPALWEVGDKTGTGDYGTTNDVGVMWPPSNKPIVMSIYFTQTAQNAAPRDEAVSAAASIVARALS